jgi:hypothetical protein
MNKASSLSFGSVIIHLIGLIGFSWVVPRRFGQSNN